MGILKTLTVNGVQYSVTPIVPADSVTLLASAWVGEGHKCSQVVEVTGVTAHTKVDLQPTADQLAEFHYKVLAFVAENNNGVITVYSIGDKPTGNHTIQITKTEVEGTGPIRGNTVGTTMPRPDWDQSDPTKADYILNKPDGIVCEETGNVIAVDDAGSRLLQGHTLYGKTTQDGTPTPESPVELVSAGNGGSIGVNVTGKNLFGGDALADKLVDMISATKDEAEGTVTFTADKVGTKKFLQNSFKPNTRYTFILYGRNSRKDSSVVNIDVDYTNGDRDRLSFSTIGEDSYVVFTSDADKTVRSLRGFNYGGTVTLHYDKCGVFEGVLTEADFVPYVGQTLTASTPNGLPGIPVASGGNYTDENGQMWICDEIDFARGVYVRPVLYEVFDGSDDENWTDRTGSKANTFSISLSRKVKSMYQVPAISNYGYGGTVDGVASAKSGVTLYYKSGNTSPSALMYFKDSACATVDELRAKLSTTPLVVAVVANEPIETPLSAEELAQYVALHTNKPNTTVYNDAGAGMKLAYVADTKLYIDKKFNELAAAIVNNA